MSRSRTITRSLSNRIILATALATLALAAGSANAQVGIPTYASGFLHTPAGSVSSLQVVGRKLTACCIGSSGNDGVEFHAESTRGIACDVSLAPLMQASTDYREIVVRLRDGIAVSGSIKVCRPPGAQVHVRCDYSPLSPLGVEVECRDQSGTIVHTFTQASPIVECDNLTLGSDPTMPPECSFAASRVKPVEDICTKLTQRYRAPCDLSFETPAGVVLVPGVVSVSFRPIICITAPCPGGWMSVSSMQITGRGFAVLECDNACIDLTNAVGTSPTIPVGSRVMCSGTGDAHVAEIYGGDLDGDGSPDRFLQVTNIGSSGNDGIHIEAPQGCDGMSLRYHDHITLIKQRDAAGREVSVTHDEGGPLSASNTFSCDFSALGSSQTLVTAYDENDNPIATAFIAVGGVAVIDYSVLCPPGSYPTFFWFKGKWHFSGCQFYFDFVIPGGGTVPNVHRLTMEPVAPLAVLGPVVECDVSSSTVGGELVVGGIELLFDTGSACDSIDFNNDGVSPDLLDLEDLLSVYAGGGCSNDPPLGTGCNDIDFNNDGVSPDSLDIEKFIEVFGGGAC